MLRNPAAPRHDFSAPARRIKLPLYWLLDWPAVSSDFFRQISVPYFSKWQTPINLLIHQPFLLQQVKPEFDLTLSTTLFDFPYSGRNIPKCGSC